VSSKLSWSHYLELIKIDEEAKRNFYAENIAWGDMLGFWKMLRYLKKRFQPKDI